MAEMLQGMEEKLEATYEEVNRRILSGGKRACQTEQEQEQQHHLDAAL
jgi:hypothetical protein